MTCEGPAAEAERGSADHMPEIFLSHLSRDLYKSQYNLGDGDLFFHFYIVIYFTVRVDIIYKNNIKKMRLVLCAGPLVAANVGPPLLLIHGLKEVIGSLKP